MENQTLWKDKKHYMWFPISFTTYYLENDRLMIRKGLFNTTIDELLLYRIVDISYNQTLLGKIFKTGNIKIKAKVDSDKEIILENISKPLETRRMLSDLIEENRKSRNVVGKEFFGDDHGHIDMDNDGICDFED